MEPHGFTNLGGLDKSTDTRDIKLGAAAVPQYTHPPVLMNQQAWAAPVEYQAKQPACGGHAGAELGGLKHNFHATPRFTWADIKTFDGFPVDSGTDMRSIFKSITKTGVLDFNLLGNDSSLSEEEYAKPAITTAMKLNASQHSGFGYGFITDRTFEGIKQFISDNGPSILLFRIGSEMWTAPNGATSWHEKDILPLRPPQEIVSGHFVVVHSYDEQYIYFLNPWSDSWGAKGHGYFGANYMPFINDVGALFPLKFTKDLHRGMTDPDVKRLQQTLNKNPKTVVAGAGPGSAGQETEYFGQLTFEAVLRFQSINKISPVSGYVGPLTRAVLNSVA